MTATASIRPVVQDETFRFACHSQLPCFTRCCADLKLVLTPYDILRLKKTAAAHLRSVPGSVHHRLVFESSFLNRFDVGKNVRQRIRTDDAALMIFAVKWLRFSLFGEPTVRMHTQR